MPPPCYNAFCNINLIKLSCLFYFLFTFQPVTNNNPWMLLYFISFLLIVSFFVLNMFVGVVVENFHKCRQHQEAEEARRREEKRLRRLEKKRRSKEQPMWFFVCLFVGQSFLRQILFHYKPDVHVHMLEPCDGNLLRCSQTCYWAFPFFISRKDLFSLGLWKLQTFSTTLTDFVLVHFHIRNLLHNLVHPIFVVSR